MLLGNTLGRCDRRRFPSVFSMKFDLSETEKSTLRSDPRGSIPLAREYDLSCSSYFGNHIIGPSRFDVGSVADRQQMGLLYFTSGHCGATFPRKLGALIADFVYLRLVEVIVF